MYVQYCTSKYIWISIWCSVMFCKQNAGICRSSSLTRVQMRHNALCSTPCTWAKLFAIVLSSAQRPGRNLSYQTPGHLGHMLAAKGSVRQSSDHHQWFKNRHSTKSRSVTRKLYCWKHSIDLVCVCRILRVSPPTDHYCFATVRQSPLFEGCD